MLGHDGNLYELEYNTRATSYLLFSGAETTSASVRALTKGSMSNFWFSGSSSDNYVRITADPVRGYVFAQREKGGVDMFTAIAEGQEWRQIGQTCAGLTKKMEEDAARAGAAPETRRFVQLAPVLQEQSSDFVVVAISGFGEFLPESLCGG